MFGVRVLFQPLTSSVQTSGQFLGHVAIGELLSAVAA